MTSPAIPTAQLRDVLNRRYAVKKFDSSKKIPADIWSALEDALVLAPSSLGLQPWKFFVVTDAGVRAKLLPHSHGQMQVADCSHLVVMTFRKNIPAEYIDKFIRTTATVRNAPPEMLDGFRQMVTGAIAMFTEKKILPTWAMNQVHLALGQFVMSAALLGVDTCPLGGIDREKYDEVLGIAGSDYATCVACPAGYRAGDDKYATLAKVRFPKEEILVRV